jgi:hypothetical protein
MKTGQIRWSSVLDEIAKIPRLHCRLALYRDPSNDKSWRLYKLFISTMIETTVDNPAVVTYGSVAFVNVTTKGQQVYKWLKPGSVKNEELPPAMKVAPGVQVSFPDVRDQINWMRCSSYRNYVGQDRGLPYSSQYPHSIYHAEYHNTPDLTLQRVISLTEPLVKTGCPAFPDYSTALFHFLYDAQHLVGQDISGPNIIVRILHTDAWIDQVILGSHRVAVTVCGNQVDGTHLVIGGSQRPTTEVLTGDMTLFYETPEGLPDRVWAVLSRNDDWLDGRDIDRRLGNSYAWKNIKAGPGNLPEQILEWIFHGEGNQMEFKSEWNFDHPERVLNTVAAFANAAGGTLLLGIQDKTGAIVGVEGQFNAKGISDYLDSITRQIRDKLTPSVEVHLAFDILEKHTVVALSVMEGYETPYGRIDKPNKQPKIYVRRNASTFEATQPEIRAISRKLDPSATPTPFSR